MFGTISYLLQYKNQYYALHRTVHYVEWPILLMIGKQMLPILRCKLGCQWEIRQPKWIVYLSGTISLPGVLCLPGKIRGGETG